MNNYETATTVEQWAPITGFEGRYSVSDRGRVRNDKTDFILSPILVDGKYRYVRLRLNNIDRGYPLHRLVASAFVPNPEGHLEVHHLDHCKDNCNAENLMWVSRSHNIRAAYDVGAMIGCGAKLSECDAVDIRDLLNEGMSGRQIAKLYDVACSTISKIKNGQSYPSATCSM